MIAVFLCECRIPWRDEEGRCRTCGKALVLPDVLDKPPRRDTAGAAKEYSGAHRSRKRIKSKGVGQ